MTKYRMFKKSDHDAMNEYVKEVEASGRDVEVTLHGSFLITSNDQLHDLPPFDSLPQQVNTIAPEPIPGQAPQWLRFKQTDSVYWTSDLVVISTRE